MTSLAALGQKVLTQIAIIDEETQFIEFEATVITDHQGTATVTKHPVEKGSNITDHIRRDPEILNLDVIVSDTPILILASLRAKASVPGGNPRTRAADAYDFVRRIKNEGKTVSVTTRLQFYPSMAINSLSVQRDKDTSNIVRMKIGLEEVIVATTDVNDIPQPVNASRQNKETIGKTNKSVASPKEAENTSGLRVGFDFAKRLLGG